MDELITKHEEFLQAALTSCFLDSSKGKYMQREIHSMLGFVLEFRALC